MPSSVRSRRFLRVEVVGQHFGAQAAITAAELRH